jgi:hypothetical protein
LQSSQRQASLYTRPANCLAARHHPSSLAEKKLLKGRTIKQSFELIRIVILFKTEHSRNIFSSAAMLKTSNQSRFEVKNLKIIKSERKLFSSQTLGVCTKTRRHCTNNQRIAITAESKREKKVKLSARR